ncbi:extracellular solute-binding protein [Psychrobacter sp. CAL346-MNA-CIBAN-0220]|uniref:extracellular solute-binding protein n=1 Tax=Psychrobacter sp. CAL346-MNA-CIBAN-0220 TaxID=3140457 RepID=UPI00332F1B64
MLYLPSSHLSARPFGHTSIRLISTALLCTAMGLTLSSCSNSNNATPDSTATSTEALNIIPKNAKQVEAAHQFINYLIRPENAKIVSEEIGYASPNLAARTLMIANKRNNSVIYLN